MKRLLAVLLFLAVPALAQSPCDGRITDQLAHPLDEAAVTKPAPGECYTDPVFGTRICRITAADPAEGVSAVIKTTYNTFRPWNADGSRILLWHRAGPRTYEIYEGDEPYAHVQQIVLSGSATTGVPTDIEQIVWDPFDPNVLYYPNNYSYSGSNKPVLYKVTLDPTGVSVPAQEIVRDFTTAPTNCNATVPLSMGHGHDLAMSANRMIGLICGNSLNPYVQFLYSITEDQVYGVKTSDTPTEARSPFSFRGGDGAYFDNTQDVTDVDFNFAANLGMAVRYEHQALGFGGGKNVLNRVNFDQPPAVGSLVSVDMSNAAATVIIGPNTGWPYPPGSTHVSLDSYNGAGWVAVSSVGTSYGQTVLDNELYLGNVVTGEVCRIGHIRTWAKMRGPWDYWGEPHPQMSEDGYRVLFSSDWMGSDTVDTYIVDLRAVTPPPVDTYRADLAWTDSIGEDGFNVERSDTIPSSTWTAVGEVGADVLVFSDPGLGEGSDHCWQIEAFNGGGTATSPETCATAPNDIDPPTVPGAPSVTFVKE